MEAYRQSPREACAVKTFFHNNLWFCSPVIHFLFYNIYYDFQFLFGCYIIWLCCKTNHPVVLSCALSCFFIIRILFFMACHCYTLGPLLNGKMYKPVLVHLGPFKMECLCCWVNLWACGATCKSMGLPVNLWACLSVCAVTCECVGLPVSLQGHLSDYGATWESMGLPVSLWVACESVSLPMNLWDCLLVYELPVSLWCRQQRDEFSPPSQAAALREQPVLGSWRFSDLTEGPRCS